MDNKRWGITMQVRLPARPFSSTLLLLLFCACAPMVPAQAARRGPQLKGTVTHAQNHSFIDLPFDVPPGVHRLTVDISDTDREKPTVLDTEILDPCRFRVASGSNQNHFTISKTDATPSLLPGAMLPGTWTIRFGVSNIRPDMTSSYEADIYFDRPIDDVSFIDRPPSAQAGWYRGDLHMHTTHSGGTCSSQSGQFVPCPVFLTAQAAARRGLDFIAISDHNGRSQYGTLRELQPYFDRLLFIPAREIATSAGHSNLFGTMQFLNHRLGSVDVPDINALASRARALGGILSISHRDAPGGEICRGCRREPNPAVDMHLITAVEAINGGDGEGLFRSLDFWEKQRVQGHWLNAEVRDLTGARYLLGNPIYVNYG